MSYIVFSLLMIPTLILVGRRWEIYPARVIGWTVAMWVFGCAAIFFVRLMWTSVSIFWRISIGMGQTGVLTGVAILVMFYRDPEREPPDLANVILAPADGRIVYVVTVSNNQFPFAVKKGSRVPLSEFTKTGNVEQQMVQIGIMMNYTDVHVNRSPIAGLVSTVVHVPGRFRSLKHKDALVENERNTTCIKSGHGEIVVVQIASRLVHRIVSYVKQGDEVSAGQRTGAILFGSQTDVLIPMVSGLEVKAEVNQRVRAGETILAAYPSQG